jgi:two-component system OmpR family response regulator
MDKALQHVICIDDEENILEITQMCLETIGEFQVTTCCSGAKGIAVALKSPPDVILLDMMMPEMDGMETLRQIRTYRELDNVIVVFMTARVQAGEIAEYLESGAAGVIAKPFDPMMISDKLNGIWKNRKL